MHGYNYVCKILFFVSDVTLRSLTVLLACIEKSKMQAFCQNCEERGYRLFKNWISKDLVLKPQIKIDIALKGCFSLPRFVARRRLDLTFLPNSSENFTRFVVEVKHRIDQDAYGILLLTKDKEIIDEISYNTHASLSINRRNTMDLGVGRELTFIKESDDKQPTPSVSKYSDEGIKKLFEYQTSNECFTIVKAILYHGYYNFFFVFRLFICLLKFCEITSTYEYSLPVPILLSSFESILRC